MKTQSKKAKGRNLQKLVRDSLMAEFTELEDGDVMSRSMGAAGEDIILSPKAKKVVGDLYIECKNTEKLNTISVFIDNEQKAGNRIPIVIHKRNRVNPIVILSLKQFIKYLRGNKNE